MAHTSENFGYGTMSMTWTPSPITVEQAIDTLTYVTGAPNNIKDINGGLLYGSDGLNLKYIKAFVDTLAPEAARELTINIKGNINLQTFQPDGSKEAVDSSVAEIAAHFSGPNRPKLVYEVARVDPNTPYEKTVAYINEHVQAGTIDAIGLSEVGAGSIAKAVAIAPIAAVEVEFSIFFQDIITNGVLSELKKHGIPIFSYSSLAGGYLTDSCAENPDRFFASIKPGDVRSHSERWSKENFPQNHALVKKLYDYAHGTKNLSLEAFALSWVHTLSGNTHKGVEFVEIKPLITGTTREKIDKNLRNIVTLSKEDLDAVDRILEEQSVSGLRYSTHHLKYEFA